MSDKNRSNEEEFTFDVDGHESDFDDVMDVDLSRSSTDGDEALGFSSDDDSSNDYLDDQDHDHEDEYDDDEGESSDGRSASSALDHVKTLYAGLSQKYPILGSKKSLAIIGIVVVVVFGLSISSKSHNPTVDTKQMASTPTTQQPSSDYQSLKGSVATISQESVSTQSKLSELSSKQASLSSSLADLNRSQQSTDAKIDRLTNEVKSLTETLAQLSKQQANLQLEKKAQPSKSSSKHQEDGPFIENPPITYSLQAIDSGRAWLVDSNGKSLTVVDGDTINNEYGNVQSINASQGTVLTTTNKVIRFK